MTNCSTVSDASVDPAASRSALIVVRNSGVAYDPATSAWIDLSNRLPNRSSRPVAEPSSLDVENRRVDPPLAVVSVASREPKDDPVIHTGPAENSNRPGCAAVPCAVASADQRLTTIATTNGATQRFTSRAP